MIRDKKRAEMEDLYDRRSYDRKDSHEIWKTVAIVGSVGLGLYAAWNKNKS